MRWVDLFVCGWNGQRGMQEKAGMKGEEEDAKYETAQARG